MYCTGGIRCEYFGARLRAAGFEKVYKLQVLRASDLLKTDTFGLTDAYVVCLIDGCFQEVIAHHLTTVQLRRRPSRQPLPSLCPRAPSRRRARKSRPPSKRG